MTNTPSFTMKDLAAELGVSVATVSRALSDSPLISEAQRRRIKALAEERHFVPNAIAVNLRSTKYRPASVIGVIVPQFSHYYFSTVLSGIEHYASARGYSLMVAQSDEKYSREVDICRSFYRNKVCGVIVSQAKDTVRYDHFSALAERGVPLVFYDRICTGISASRVVVDDYAGAHTAVSYLAETGARRIAFYGSAMNMEISKNRFNGYKDALLEHGLEYDGDIVKLCDNRYEAERITPGMLECGNRPDAFFAVNDDTAIGVLYTAKRMGFNVPRDVAICGFTNGQRAVACDPMLTTVEQRGVAVGEQAADILISQVEGRLAKDRPERRVVKTRLIVRGTTA